MRRKLQCSVISLGAFVKFLHIERPVRNGPSQNLVPLTEIKQVPTIKPRLSQSFVLKVSGQSSELCLHEVWAGLNFGGSIGLFDLASRLSASLHGRAPARAPPQLSPAAPSADWLGRNAPLLGRLVCRTAYLARHLQSPANLIGTENRHRRSCVLPVTRSPFH